MCFFFQAEDGIRDIGVTGVQTCALPIWLRHKRRLCHVAGISRRRRGVVADGETDGDPCNPKSALDAHHRPSECPCKIGRASCRERVQISVVAVSLKKKKARPSSPESTAQ